jgi:hypothetical protein
MEVFSGDVFEVTAAFSPARRVIRVSVGGGLLRLWT